ncbi:MAG: phosphatase PAP2 family protein [Edaphobacter sp.]
MNPFDADILHFLNQFSQRSSFFDYLINTVSTNQLLTGALIMSLFWWAWFRNEEGENQDRPIVISSIFLCTIALFLARALSVLLPFRQRPWLNPILHFRVPLGEDLQSLINWSSFPSDHAVFYFALATSIFLLSRKLGIAVYCYVFFVICAPRIYMGVHYPTDILAGALLGTGIGCLAQFNSLRVALSSGPMDWLRRSPASFYPCFFLTTFLFATMFEPIRSIAVAAVHASRHLLHQ